MNKYKSIITDIFTANLQEELSVENNIRLFFSNILSFILIVISLIFTYIAMSNNNFVLSYALLLLVSIHIFNYILLIFKKNILLHRYINFISIFLIFIFILFKPGPNGLAYLWFFSTPLITVLLLDFRHAAYANTIYIIIMSFSFIYLGDYLPNEYTYALKLRFIISYFTLSTFVFTYVYLSKRVELSYKTKFYKDIDTLSARKEFISILSKQVRDSSDKITQLSENSINFEMTSKQKKYIEDLQYSSDNIVNLLNNILEISSFVNNEPDKLQTFNIISVIRNTISLFTSKNQDIELNYNDDFDTTYLGNPIRLKQIVFNIIDSIINKTVKNSSKILVNISNNNIKSVSVILSIEIDSSDYIDKINKQEESLINYFQLRATQNLIKSVNGDFSIINKKNKKLCFVFSCNFKKNIHNDDYKDRFNQLLFDSQTSDNIIKLNKFDIEQLKKMSVLLISDKVSVQGEVKVNLINYVRNIDVATSWSEISELFSQVNYNFILLDMDSSDKPLKIAKKIREYEAGLDFRTIIIAINIDNVSNNLHKVIASGIDEYIHKPFDLLSLVNKLKIHFSKI